MFLFCFGDRVSYGPGWPRTHYVTKDDLELPILLPLHLWSAGVIGVHHQVGFKWYKGSNTGLRAHETNTLPSDLFEKLCAH